MLPVFSKEADISYLFHELKPIVRGDVNAGHGTTLEFVARTIVQRALLNSENNPFANAAWPITVDALKSNGERQRFRFEKFGTADLSFREVKIWLVDEHGSPTNDAYGFFNLTLDGSINASGTIYNKNGPDGSPYKTNPDILSMFFARGLVEFSKSTYRLVEPKIKTNYLSQLAYFVGNLFKS